MSSETEATSGDEGVEKDVISSSELTAIESALEGWDEPNSEVRQLFEESQKKWDERIRSDLEAIRESEHLTEQDFAIRINLFD